MKYPILILLLLLFQWQPVFSQFKVKDLLKKAGKVSVPEVDLFKQPEPITSSFKDVDITNSLPATFGNNEKYEPLDSLPFGPNGWLLKPGFFEILSESFCIRAGTAAPSKGKGYMSSKLAGPMAEVINHILWNSMFHPAISQRDVQVLLWTIIAKTKYSNFSDGARETADSILTPKDIAKLKGSAVSVLSDELFEKKITKMPAALQPILKAENKIRQLNASSSRNYEEYEHWAMAAGIVPEQKTDSTYYGRWTYVSVGKIDPAIEKILGYSLPYYYVRYFPQGYKAVRVQLYVPFVPFKQLPVTEEGHGPFASMIVDKEGDTETSQHGLRYSKTPEDEYYVLPGYDPCGFAIDPADAEMQRLVLSGSWYCGKWDQRGPGIQPTLSKRIDDFLHFSEIIKFLGGAKYEVSTERACACVRG